MIEDLLSKQMVFHKPANDTSLSSSLTPDRSRNLQETPEFEDSKGKRSFGGISQNRGVNQQIGRASSFKK